MGRIPEEMSQSVQNLQLGYIRPYHREIARRLVLGQKQSDICRDLGLSASRISIIVNSPLFKIEVCKLENERDKGVVDVQRTLQEVSPLALEVMERTMLMGRSEKLRFDAASSLLDRAGYGAIGKQAINISGMVKYGEVESLSDVELKKMVELRVKEMGRKMEKDEEEKERMESVTVEFEPLESVCVSTQDGQVV